MLEDDNAGRVRFLVLELSDLIGNLLLAIATGLDGSFNVADALNGDTVLIVAIDELIFKLADFVDQDTELVCNVGDIVVACFTPDGQCLLKMY